MCQKFPGYLRVAIADPQPERRFFRRGWVSFERNVNIKEICWNLNNIRLRDCDMGAIVNRDLSRRIRPVNGIAQHKQVSLVACGATLNPALSVLVCLIGWLKVRNHSRLTLDFLGLKLSLLDTVIPINKGIETDCKSVFKDRKNWDSVGG